MEEKLFNGFIENQTSTEYRFTGWTIKITNDIISEYYKCSVESKSGNPNIVFVGNIDLINKKLEFYKKKYSLVMTVEGYNHKQECQCEDCVWYRKNVKKLMSEHNLDGKI